MHAWTMDGFSVPFASKRLCETFRRYWPGALGVPTRVEVSPFEAPIWHVAIKQDGRILGRIENRTHTLYNPSNL